jgi:hypothetical protein
VDKAGEVANAAGDLKGGTLGRVQGRTAPRREGEPSRGERRFRRRQNLCAHRVEQNWDLIARFERRLADAGELEGRELKAALTWASWAGPARNRWRDKR